MGGSVKQTYDGQLIEKLKSGDRESFEKIYGRYYQPLFNYGCQFGGVKEYVHDAIQDLFIDLWNSKERLNITYSLQAYIFKSLRYKIQREWGKEKTRADKRSEYYQDSFGILFDEQQFLGIHNTEADLLNSIKENVKKLAPKQRELIYLIYYQTLSYDEASKIMGISKKTAYNQIHSAINTLRVNIREANICLVCITWIEHIAGLASPLT